MNDDLISRSKLIEELYSVAYACSDDNVNEILSKQLESNIECIKQQPTAYDVDNVVEQIEKQKNLIDKWEKRLEILDEVYIKNLRDKIKTKEKKFNKHMKVITRINELEMCIKDLKQLGGGLDD